MTMGASGIIRLALLFSINWLKPPALAGAFKVLKVVSFITRSVNMVLAESATVHLL